MSEEEPQTVKPDSRQRQTTQTIEIGWIHQDESQAKQVRVKQGGGTRKVVMDTSCRFNDILKEGKIIFF